MQLTITRRRGLARHIENSLATSTGEFFKGDWRRLELSSDGHFAATDEGFVVVKDLSHRKFHSGAGGFERRLPAHMQLERIIKLGSGFLRQIDRAKPRQQPLQVLCPPPGCVKPV